jgi:predicted polyphosphate/ATP-dependent NAD kinase
MKSNRHKKTSVGIIVNPASGRDVRRLIAKASVFPNTEKANMIMRMLAAFSVFGIGDVLMMPDRGGVAGRIIHSISHSHYGLHPAMPAVNFLEMPIEDSPIDTLRAVELMVSHGVGVIVVMGGDGTHRLVAQKCGDVPLVTLSTGTNNAFPEIREATVAGLAAGLVATQRVSVVDVCSQSKVLHIVRNGALQDMALVDICTSSAQWVGAKALWQPESLKELFLTFAEPHSVGLSSIGGLLHPVKRCSAYGLSLKLAPPGKGMFTVTVPIAPGLLAPIGVLDVREIRPKEIWEIETEKGTVALDGEREIEFYEKDKLKVWLDMEGPLIVDIQKTMFHAAKDHLLIEAQVQ